MFKSAELFVLHSATLKMAQLQDLFNLKVLMMQLIGMLDSPYVRRVAISLKRLGLPFKHLPLSVFQDFDEFRQINPLVKAPTLLCDDGEVLTDSTLILDYIEEVAGSSNLMPSNGTMRLNSLRLVGIALTACEKTAQIVYERNLRPPEKQHQPWIERLESQLVAAYDALEGVTAVANPWLISNQIMQPDITVAVSWRFTQLVIPDVIDAARYPALVAFSKQAEQLPEFLSTPLE